MGRKNGDSIRDITFRVCVVVEPDEGRFHAYCPALKGLHVDGETKKEALENAKEAAVVYVSSLVKHGSPLPIGPDFTRLEDSEYDVSPGALIQRLTFQWPSQPTFGTK